MKILLTGGAGYIGSHVVLSLLDQNHKVTIIDDFSTGHKSLIPENIECYNCNINDIEKVTKIIKSTKFDLLMHFAGFIKVEESVSNPEKYFKNNTENAISLFNTCYKNNLNNIIFSSTAAVYGNQSKEKLISEEENLKPLNPYGESKIKTENFLLENKDKFNSVILRYFNVAGADADLRAGLISKEATHLIKIISEVAVGKRDNVFIYGNDYDTFDGTAVRDYIHVSDLADIHVHAGKYLLEKQQSTIFNCGYGQGYSVLDVIKMANQITKNKIKYKFYKRRDGDAERLVANVEKINNHIKWKPKYNDLKKIIESAIDWERDYEKNL